MTMTIDHARRIVEDVAVGVGHYDGWVVLQALCVCQRACMSDVSDEQMRDQLLRLVNKVGATHAD